MPKEPAIVGQKIVIPVTKEENQYGDLLFTDGNGTQYKIGNKRPQVFESILIGKAVELFYAQYMERKYICAAHLVDDALPESKEPAPLLPEHQAEIDRAVNASHEEKPKIAPQAIGMTLKEVGELMRVGLLGDIFNEQQVKQIIAWYKEQMLLNMGLL